MQTGGMPAQGQGPSKGFFLGIGAGAGAAVVFVIAAIVIALQHEAGSGLESDLAEKKKAVVDLRGELSAAQDAEQAERRAKKQLEARIRSLEGQLKALRDQRAGDAATEGELAQLRERLTGQLDEVKQQADQLGDERDALKQDKAALEARVAELEARAADLAARYQALKEPPLPTALLAYWPFDGDCTERTGAFETRFEFKPGGGSDRLLSFVRDGDKLGLRVDSDFDAVPVSATRVYTEPVDGALRTTSSTISVWLRWERFRESGIVLANLVRQGALDWPQISASTMSIRSVPMTFLELAYGEPEGAHRSIKLHLPRDKRLVIQFEDTDLDSGRVEIESRIAELPLKQWMHFTIVQTETQLIFYMDGKPHGSLSHEGRFAKGFAGEMAGSTRVSIGRPAYVPGRELTPFNGAIDELAIFGRALSPDEVLALWQRGVVELGE